MTTRADKFTVQTNKITYFSDFLTDFSLNPVTGELGRVTNEQAVSQSIKNMILTNRGERFYDDNKGSMVKSSLFDLSTPLIEDDIIASVREVIMNYFPHVELIQVETSTYQDFYKQFQTIDENTIRLIIRYSIINIPNQEFTLEFAVERIR